MRSAPSIRVPTGYALCLPAEISLMMSRCCAALFAMLCCSRAVARYSGSLPPD